MAPLVSNSPTFMIELRSASDLLSIALSALDTPPDREGTATAVVVVVASTRREFAAALALEPAEAIGALTSGSIHRVSTTRRIRLLFAPTVSHLRAIMTTAGHLRPCTLLLYGLLRIHRATSEWTARGLAATAAIVADAACGVPGLRVVMLEPTTRLKLDNSQASLGNVLLGETLPLLGTAREPMPRVEVERVLNRWFLFDRGENRKVTESYDANR